MMIKNISLIIVLFLGEGCCNGLLAQQKNKIDSTAQKANKTEDKRNVMLNAESNAGPRDVNVGLPVSVGGMSILENDLPVVYYSWPEMPNRAWRSSVSLSGASLMKIGEAAVSTGDFGFALNSYDKLGGEKTEVVGNLAGSHFGWLKGDVNISGPLGKKWFYTAGVYANYDPQSFDMKFARYSDRTQIYRAGITKRFKNGEISILYKYANSANLTNYAVFKYKEGGKTEQINNFKIGRSSLFVNDGILRVKDVLSGEYKDVDLGGSDAATFSHNLDLLGHFDLKNNWNFKFSTRFRYAEAAILYGIPIGTLSATANDGYTYKSTGQTYTGYVNSMMTMYTPKTPTRTVLSRFEFDKSTSHHNWRLGMTEYYYDVDKFHSNRSFYYQTVSANPDKLLRNSDDGGSSNTDASGFYNYNIGSEYHDGHENKITVYMSDTWNALHWLTLNYGINLRNQHIKGSHYLTDRTDGVVFDPANLTYFNHNWYHIGGNFEAVANITQTTGIMASFTYTESNGQLESYSGNVTPNLVKSRSPLAGLGVFYSTPKLSIVSQATYLTKNNYLSRLNLVNPDNASESYAQTVYYNIQTVGWTTDVVTNPFKGFSFHYLLTIQNPVYKKYSFTAFGNNYSYNNKNVLEISKVLMEIDPSYSFNKIKIWASLRYFSKQFANLTNALFFAPRWETFGGINYKISNHMDLGVTVVNFLNQTGAKGTINGAELVTNPSSYYNSVLTGSYILPMTLQGSLNFKF